MMAPKRIEWIDIGKGISMIIVILFHTEIYYLGESRSLTTFLIPPLMNYFFFLSGIFFIKHDKIDAKKKLLQILKTIIVPYVIFSTIIFIPKTLKWGNDITIGLYFREVFLGQATWFIMALMVGQILMIVISKLKPIMMLLVGIALYIIYMVMSPKVVFQPFYYMEGLRSVLFLVLGHLYNRNRENIKLPIKNSSQLSILLLVVLYCLYYFEMTVFNISVFILVTSVVGLHSFSVISKGIEDYCHTIVRNSIIYIGQNSLVYYFLNGGVISVLIIILRKCSIYSDPYVYVIVALTLIIISIAVRCILRFCPFITGRK